MAPAFIPRPRIHRDGGGGRYARPLRTAGHGLGFCYTGRGKELTRGPLLAATPGEPRRARRAVAPGQRAPAAESPSVHGQNGVGLTYGPTGRVAGA